MLYLKTWDGDYFSMYIKHWQKANAHQLETWESFKLFIVPLLEVITDSWCPPYQEKVLCWIKFVDSLFICLSSLNLVSKYAAWESAKLSLNNRAADDDYCYCRRLWSCYLLYKPRDTSAMLFSCTELDVSCAWGKIMDPGALDKNHCLPSKDLSLRIIKFNLYRSSGTYQSLGH